MIGIYTIRNVINQKVYVGQSQNIEKRFIAHRCLLRASDHHSSYLQNAWNRYGEDSFEFVMVEETNLASIDQREQFWMDKLGAHYNVQPRAASARGYKHTAATKKKISEAQLGRVVPEDRREKISNALKGQVQTEECRRKRSASMRAVKHDSKWNTAVSESLKCKGKKYKAFGKEMYLVDWANERGINRATLSNRVKRSGMSMEEALTTPLSRGKNLKKRKVND